tara:strand:- start:165 stop:785 length:621 start_codon:yes stop_codon:yes gene_type:complete
MSKYIIEFLGTFFLVLIIGLTGNPIAIGLGLSILIYMGAHISGAHYNPAVSLAMILNGEINLKEFAFYTLSQMSGALVSTYLVILLGNNDFSVIPNSNNLTDLFIAEILFTFLLVFVILNVALNKNLKGNQFFGLAIGLTVAVGAFSVGDISGAVFNPAVSFGPSFFSFIDPQSVDTKASSEFFFYYLITGISGSVIASFLYKKIS